MASYDDILKDNRNINPDYDGFQHGYKCPSPSCTGKRNDTLNINTRIGYAKCFRCREEFYRDKPVNYYPKNEYKKAEPKRPEKRVLKPLAKKIEIDKMAWVYNFFKKRGISENTVKRMRIGSKDIYFQQSEKIERAIAFPFFIEDKIYSVKYRGSEKKFMQEKDATPIFYGLDDIKESDFCIIVEGEIDKLSFDEAGMPYCISVPNGGNNTNAMEFLDNSFPYLEHIRTFYLAVDNDEVGIGMREALARRLGYEYCSVVEFPEGCKDPNEVLLKYGANKLVECINDAKDYPKFDIESPSTNFHIMKKIYEEGYEGGAKLGWTEHDKKIRWFKGVHTLLTGNPQDGKSVYMDNVMIKLIKEQDWKFGVYSPENGMVEIHKHRLAEIWTGKHLDNVVYNGKERMTLHELEMTLKILDNHIKFINPGKDEEVTDDYIFEQTRYLVRKYGIDALILDPFSALDIEENSNTIKKYNNNAKRVAVYNNINFITVAHPTKMPKILKGKSRTRNTEVPTGYDVSDSRHWFQKVDNGLTWHARYDDNSNSTELVRSHNELHVWKVKHKFMGRRGYCIFDYEPHSQRIIPRGETWENNFYEEKQEVEEGAGF